MTPANTGYEAEIDGLLLDLAYDSAGRLPTTRHEMIAEARQAFLALLDRARAKELQTIQLHMVIHEYDIPMDKRLDEYLGKRIAVFTGRLSDKEE